MRSWLEGAGRRNLVVLLSVGLISGACATGETEETTTTAAGATTTVGETTTTGGATGEGPRRGGSLTIGLDAETAGWDPPDGLIGFSGRTVNATTYDTLTAVAADGSVVPNMLESLESNDDLTVWTLTLRPGILFHDGTPVTAEALDIHLGRMRAEDSAVAPSFSNWVSVEVVDELTLTVTLAAPSATFPQSLYDGAGTVVSPTAVEELGEDFGSMPVGAGPYEFVEWVRDDHLTVRRFADYWRDDTGWLDEITYRPFPDESARAAALRAGDVDVIFTTNPADILDFDEDESFIVHLTNLGTDGLYLNHAVAPTDDLRIRQAMEHAIDKQLLVDLVWDGVGDVINTPFDPESSWYVEVETPAYDPEAARALVDEYVAETGGPPVISIIPRPGGQTHVTFSEALVPMLEEVGFQVTIEQVADTNEYVTRLIDGDYSVATRSHGDVRIDPDFEMYRLHHSESFLNIAKLGTEEMDAALDLGRSTTDVDTRREAYATVQRILAENIEGIFVRTSSWAVITADYVQGVWDWTLPGGEPGLRRNWYTPINADSLWRTDV